MSSCYKHINWQSKQYSYSEFYAFIKNKIKDNSLEEWELDIYSFTLDWLNTDVKTFEVMTSGSTGTSKMIILNRADMIKSAHTTGFFFKLKPNDKVLHCLPTKYIAGKMMIVRALVLGLDLYVANPKIDALTYIKNTYAFCALIPLQIQYALDNQLFNQIQKISTLIIGGAHLSNSYLKRLKKLKTKVYATYGMTETITHIALQKLNGINKSEHFSCLPNFKVGQDERGCLIINNSINPKKKWFTNDLATILSPTKFKIIGRIDDVINTGGLKINPSEIESIISPLINSPFMIGYLKDNLLGQKLVLLIESNETVVYKNILIEIKQLLGSNKTPKEVYFIQKLLLTPNGKLDRKKNNIYLMNL